MNSIKILLSVFALSTFTIACKNSKPESQIAETKSQIKQLEDSLMAAPVGKNYQSHAPELVKLMSDYVEKNPKDTISAMYLFKAGDISRGLGKFDDAINFWQSLCEKYPDHRRAPDALFLQAFTFENDVKDLNKAKNLYEEFLKKYPNHAFSANIPVILENLGKSPEELIEALKKKNQKK